jgi:UDP-N-acetylmuramoylalanine--D-glutamate ligase
VAGVNGRPPLPPGPYLIVGLARSGSAAARVLRAHGEVIGCDAGDPPEARALRGLEGVELHLGSDGRDLVERAATVVKSPGVPSDAPAVAAARALGRELVGELELSWRLLSNAFVAVTGTNGKTTTVELLGAIHRAAEQPVAVAGNVGTPLAALVGELTGEAVVVCEASSFQLEDTRAFAPECAVLLNLTPDHLDRHGSFEAYADAKMRAFARQRPEHAAVAPQGLAVPGRARRVSFGGPGADLEHRDQALWWRGERLIGEREIRLRGGHNVLNAMAAAAAALVRSVPTGAVREALGTFAGVAHRLEEVADRDGVLWVNDSKATNVASALVALEAFPGGVHLILGGRAKGGGFAELREPVGSRCRACYLVGEAAERLEAELAGAGVPLERSGDLASAVEAAGRGASPGDTVLLSPACASFDQYRDFEERGEHFRALVAELGARAG